MTYIIGWNDGEAVFLVADSAVTASSFDEAAVQTSFGEAEVSEDRSAVREGLLKLINLHDSAFAYSGSVEAAHAVVSGFQAKRRSGTGRLQSLTAAVDDYCRNGQSARTQIFTAFTGTVPRLFAVDTHGRPTVREMHAGDAGHRGSLPDRLKAATKVFIEGAYATSRTPMHALVTVVSFLQSHGLRVHLLGDGVGGAFSGLLVQESISWQDDTCYYVIDDSGEARGLVVLAARGDGLFLESTMNRQMKVLLSSALGHTFESWKKRWRRECEEIGESGRYGYLVILNTQSWTVVVNEMKGRLDNGHVRVRSELTEDPRGILHSLSMSPQVRRAAVAIEPTAEPKPPDWQEDIGSFRMFYFAKEG